MKRNAFLISLASIATLLLGCGAEHQILSKAEVSHSGGLKLEIQDQESQPVSHGVEYKAGRGLTVPPVTSKTLGLKIVDVAEGKAARRIELALRVFDIERSFNDEFALASGFVDTDQAGFLEPGASVSIDSADAAPTRGEVIRMDPASANVTGLAEVIVRLPASDNVKIGTFVDGSVTTRTAEDVVVIPREALLKTAEGYFAYVVNGDSLFRTQIGVGGQEGEFVEVTEGLYTGDRVVLQPIMPLWLAELQAIRGGKACADGH